MTLFDEKQQLHIVIRNKGPFVGVSKRVYRNYSKYVQNVHVDNKWLTRGLRPRKFPGPELKVTGQSGPGQKPMGQSLAHP